MIWFCHWYPLIDYNSFWSCIGICTVSEKTWNLQILTQFREYIYNGLTLSLISVIQVKIRAPSGEWPRKAGWSSQAHYKVVQTLKTWIWKHTHKRCGRTNICYTGLVSWTCEELIRWYMRADWYCTQTRRGIKFKYKISHHWHRIGCGNHPIYHREERAIRKGGSEWKHLFFFSLSTSYVVRLEPSRMIPRPPRNEWVKFLSFNAVRARLSAFKVCLKGRTSKIIKSEMIWNSEVYDMPKTNSGRASRAQ